MLASTHLPSEAELLDAWERAVERRPLERGLALLCVSSPAESAEALSSLSLGERDARLLRLYEAIFGARLDNRVACPACADVLTFDGSTTDLLRAIATIGPTPDGGHVLKHGGWTIRFRLPDTRALADAMADPSDARYVLLCRCIIDATADDDARGDCRCPPAVEAALVAEMERLDQQSALSYTLTCPSCGHAWIAPFDVVSYLWVALEAWALRTLREVHLLAASYGWREPDVLRIGPWRRQLYLAMSGHV